MYFNEEFVKENTAKNIDRLKVILDVYIEDVFRMREDLLIALVDMNLSHIYKHSCKIRSVSSAVGGTTVHMVSYQLCEMIRTNKAAVDDILLMTHDLLDELDNTLTTLKSNYSTFVS